VVAEKLEAVAEYDCGPEGQRSQSYWPKEWPGSSGSAIGERIRLKSLARLVAHRLLLWWSGDQAMHDRDNDLTIDLYAEEIESEIEDLYADDEAADVWAWVTDSDDGDLRL